MDVHAHRFYISLDILAGMTGQGSEIKSSHVVKEEVKLTSLADNVIIFVEKSDVINKVLSLARL